MPQPYKRVDRIAEELAHNTTVFLHENLSEAYGIVTCTSYDITSDLRDAKAWISFYPPLSDNRKVDKILSPYKKELFNFLKKKVPLKHYPKIIFYIDHSDEHASKINNLLDSL